MNLYIQYFKYLDANYSSTIQSIQMDYAKYFNADKLEIIVKNNELYFSIWDKDSEEPFEMPVKDWDKSHYLFNLLRGIIYDVLQTEEINKIVQAKHDLLFQAA